MADLDWTTLWQWFHAALDVPPGERETWLESNIGDPALRAEVAGLLAAHEQSGTPLDRVPDRSLFGPLHDGERVGAWRVTALLGRGGMGEVYRVERADGAFQRSAALKILAPGLAGPALQGRFERERRILATLDHPGIAGVLDGGTLDNGRPYLVMDYIEGEPLAEYCRRNGLTVNQRLALLEHVGRAVDHAHRRLVIHRDIKPSNILVTADGQPVLLDFGVAKLLDPDADADLTEYPGARIHTPRYASPEQLIGGPAGVAADIYALGILMYELLTGQVPYPEIADPARALEQRRRLPPALDNNRHSSLSPTERLAPELDWIVRRALEFDADDRYPGVRAWCDDLAAVRSHRPPRARPVGRIYRAGKFARRNWRWLGPGVAAVLVLGAMSVELVRENARTREALSLKARQQARAEQTVSFLRELFELADPTRAAGQSLTAAEILERGRQRLQRGQLDLSTRAHLQQVLAGVYSNLGDYDSAEALSLEALEAARATADAEGEIRALLVLGRTRDLAGKHDAAAELLERALAMQTRRAGDDWRLRAEIAEALGVALQSRGELDRAGTLFRDAEALRREHLTPAHPLLARSALRLGSWHWLNGRLKQAEAFYSRALASRRAADPPDLPALAQAMDAHAAALHALGRLDAAVDGFREAADLRRRVLGGDHRHTADSLSNLGAALYDSGRDAEAAKALEEAITIYRRLFDEDNPVMAKTLNNLGLVRRRQGAAQQARTLFERALAIHRAAYGGNHPKVAGNLNNLGLVAEDREDWAAAARAYVSARDILVGALGPEHPDLGYPMTNLGRVRVYMGRIDEARGLLERAHDHRVRTLPPDHPQMADTLLWRGLSECLDGAYDPALEHLAAARRLRSDRDRVAPMARNEAEGALAACAAAAGAQAPMAYQNAARGALLASHGPEHAFVRLLDAISLPSDHAANVAARAPGEDNQQP